MNRFLMNLFGQPNGLLGKIGGKIMAASNQQINQWTVSLLDVKPSDRVLEIGFGPGVAAKKISDILLEGKYVGIDVSSVMLN